MVVSGTTIISYNILASGTEVEHVDDILSVQKYLEDYFEVYGYTFDDPNVIVNPYNISPLTALVIFDNKGSENIEVTVCSKNGDFDFSYMIEGNNNYVPIYGLYADYDNKVILKIGNRVKELNIKTDKIEDIDIITNYKDRDLTFVDMDKYVYAIDRYGDIRWYISGYGGKLDSYNGHFLVHSDRDIGDGYYTGIVEMDMLGKIYYNYYIDKGGYKKSYVIDNNNCIYVLSDGYVNYVSLLNGDIIKSYKTDDKYDYIEIEDNKIICSNSDKSISIDIKNGTIEDIDRLYINNNLYYNDINELNNYKFIDGINLGGYTKTSTSNKRIWLFNYKKLDKNIDVYKESDRLVVKGNFASDNDIYVILDGIKGKKVYKMDNDGDNYYKYINDIGLKGKYTIYIKIDNVLYKSEYFVKFT